MATLSAALEQVVTDVEDRHDVEVDLVVVGECDMEPRLEALVAAVREAAHNAAQHSGMAEVSVYVEVEPQRVTAYVRDRGKGFDLDAVEPGRVGVRESIIGRMARHGGRAQVHTAPDDGTEVVLEVGRTAGPGGAGVRRPGCSSSTTTSCSAPACGPSSATPWRWSARRPTSSRPCRASGPPIRRSSCSTCTCPAAAGKAVLETLKPERPDLVFLALSVSDAAEDVIAVIRAGARGYVTKTISSDELAAAIAPRARRRRGLLPPAGGVRARRLLRRSAHHRRRSRSSTSSAPREREVMRLIARGYTYKEIARRLSLSVKTVESHVSAVLRKLQLSSRHELTRWATDRRLI